MRVRSLFSVAVAVLLLGSLATPGWAAPICTGDDKSDCGGRTVAEPRNSLTFITPSEFVDAANSLAAEFPGWLTLESLGTSFDGHEILVIEITDPDAPTPIADRPLLYVSQSIHGGEMGGREGMARVMEDLVRSEDPDVIATLGEIRVVQFIPNSDGWAAGDVPNGGLAFTRQNGNGTDLNRQFPWPGWIPETREPVSEPESQAIVADVMARRAAGEEVVGSVDIHGFQNSAGAWVMLSSGEFDWNEYSRQIQIADSVGGKLDEVLGPDATFQIGQALGGAVTPQVLTSSSEWAGGLSGSGFLGDWLSQEDGLDTASISTIELFLINGQNSAMFSGDLAQIHVDAVRAIVRGLMDTALVAPDDAIDLDGPVGYFLADQEVTHATQPDPVTPMRFFEDLAPFTNHPVTAIDDFDTDLAGLTSVVVTSDQAAAVAGAPAALRRWVESGGTLVLTDSGLTLLEQVAGIDAGGITEQITDFGNADFVDREHPLATNVRANAIHTYEPATLGYDTEFELPQSPVWTVARAAWEEAGGVTVATTEGETSIGEVAVGDGVVRVIGGLLPPAVTTNKVLYGLANYTPADTGYYVFFNALDNDGTPPVAAPAPRTPPPPAPPAPESPLPTTGGGAIPLALGLLGLGSVRWAARRR